MGRKRLPGNEALERKRKRDRIDRQQQYAKNAVAEDLMRCLGGHRIPAEVLVDRDRRMSLPDMPFGDPHPASPRWNSNYGSDQRGRSLV